MIIEVICHPSGDRAEADSPEAAIVAARTLCQDDSVACPYQGRDRTVTFVVNGRAVRTCRERDLWSAV